MKIKLKIFSGLSAFLIATSFVAPAHAEDLEPTDMSWGTIYTDDGFSKSFTIYKYGTESVYTDLGTASSYNLEVQCENKELTVLVYAGPIGIYPTSGLNRIGTAQVKIDSGKISKYKYVAMKDSAGIVIWSPKTLMTAVLKGKRQVAFKIPSSIQQDAVAVFLLGDLTDYVAKFKSLGCPLK
jgi:hypothetical protein